jgi:hypothetical protein
MSTIISEHSFSFGGLAKRHLAQVWILVIFVALGLGGLLLAVARPNSGTLLPALLMFVIGLGFAVPIYAGYQQRTHWVKLTDDSIEWQDEKGEHQAAWADIREVRRLEKIINNTFRQRELTLTLADAQEVKFDQRLDNFDGLADRMQDRTAELLYDSYRKQLENGMATFGPVILARDSITLRRKEFPFSADQRCQVFRGMLAVMIPGRDLEESRLITLSEVPNYFVLLRLLTEMGKFNP